MAGRKGRGLASSIVLRRISQLVFLGLFFILFIATDYNGSDHLEGAVNILFRLDPFIAACVMLGVKSFVALLLPALAVLLLSAIFGRGFCGWFCPMGTLLDLAGKAVVPAVRRQKTFYPGLPAVVLVFSLLTAVCGFAVAGYVDPFSLLVRGMAQALYPMVNSLTVGFFTFTYHNLPDFANQFTEPVYALLQSYVLPSGQKYFQLAYLSGLLLAGIFFLEGLQRRFFCRNICPLGAMLGVLGRKSFLKGTGGNSDCRACRMCSSRCRMGAIDETRSIDMATCNLCFECADICPRQIIDFGFSILSTKAPPVSLARRRFVGAALLGVLLPSIKGVDVLAKNGDPLLIRPPGALAEAEFLSRCVRCAECIQVCIGNGLQPAFLQAGLNGMFSPLLVARTGYCEFNCTLCGQVCPTGAIRELSMAEKHSTKIGHAWFDKNTCLPYAKGIACMVCEEHCPTPEKAIRFKDVEIIADDGTKGTIKQPYVVSRLCIGCGICETRCPLPGRAAVYVTSGGEDRHPDSVLPVSASVHYGG